MAATACGGGGDGQRFTAPDVAAIVTESLPASLQPGGSIPQARLAPADDPNEVLAALAAKYIQNLFANSYLNSRTMTASPGYLDAQISHIMTRLGGIASRGGMNNGACLDGPGTSFTVDLSSTLDNVAKITLPHLQCSGAFNSMDGTPAADGSGLVFGEDGAGNYSLWTAVGAMNSTDFAVSGGFLSFANVTNSGSTTPGMEESVDVLLLSYGGPNSQPNPGFGQVIHFIANSTAKTFEMFYAENGGSLKGLGASDGDVWLGGGSRMISDGTRIYADGLIYNMANGTAGFQSFTACITASTMTVDTAAGACDTLKTTFTLSTTPSLNYCDIVGMGPTCTLPVPGPGAGSPMGTAQVNAVKAAFPITAAPAGVTAY